MLRILGLVVSEHGWRLLALIAALGLRPSRRSPACSATPNLVRWPRARRAGSAGRAGRGSLRPFGHLFHPVPGFDRRTTDQLGACASPVAAIAVSLGTGIGAAFIGQRLSDKNALLDTALNNMNHGLMMFDNNSRVILCNQRYIDLYHLPAGAIRPGLTLREVIDRRIAAGTFEGDAEEYCESARCRRGRCRRLCARMGVSSRRGPSRGGTSKAVITQPDGRTIEVVGQPALTAAGLRRTRTSRIASGPKTNFAVRANSYNTVLENVPSVIAVRNADDRKYIFINRAAEEQFGMKRDHVHRKDGCRTCFRKKPPTSSKSAIRSSSQAVPSKFLRHARGGDQHDRQASHHEPPRADPR